MKLQIDSREPPEVILKIKKYFPNAEISIKTLSCGDIWLNNGEIIIERKSQITGDLFQSIHDGRLLNQAAEMRAICEWCYIVIEGPLMWHNNQVIKNSGKEMHPHYLQGKLEEIQDFGVTVTHCNDANDFPKKIEVLWESDRSKIVILPPRKFGLSMSPMHKILCAVPGIGKDKADKLLMEFGSAIKALECLWNYDCELPEGISKKTRLAAREAFGLSIEEKKINK